jgi:hypothetical protein
MLRFVMRMLVPSRLGRMVRSRIDARYVTKIDHRRDIKDALWEVQMLRREVVSLRREVDRLRQGPGAVKSVTDSRAAAQSQRLVADTAQARRLATETAEALDQVLQNEVLVWQAIDDLKARLAAAETPVTEGIDR